MKYTLKNHKINFILDELAEEYKSLLIETALNQTQELDIDNINISEITKIDIEIKETLKNKNKNDKINKTSRLIFSCGLVYLLFGLMLIMVSEADNSFTDNPLSMISIIFTFLGTIITIAGLTTSILLNNKKSRIYTKNIADYEIQLVNKWRILEGIIYEIFPQNDKLSLRTMLNNLDQNKIISKEEFKTLNSLMYYRNEILHNPSRKFEYREIKFLLNQAQELIEKMSEMI